MGWETFEFIRNLETFYHIYFQDELSEVMLIEVLAFPSDGNDLSWWVFNIIRTIIIDFSVISI